MDITKVLLVSIWISEIAGFKTTVLVGKGKAFKKILDKQFLGYLNFFFVTGCFV